MFRYLVFCAALVAAGCDATFPTGGGAVGQAEDVDWSASVPFGEVARVCDARGRKLGKRVERIGRGYALYDSNPSAGGARNFHITGFSDGCPRRLTAATVIISAPSSYERYRFGPASANLPYSKTDAAYDRLKRNVCGASKRKPCGSRIKSLDRSSFFVSSYRNLGNNNSWSEVLIHDGEVLAAAVKSGG
jgi:hypothetical protein